MTTLNQRNMFSYLIAALFALMLTNPVVALAGAAEADPIMFIDRDGDGISDLAPDENGDGIPDYLRKHPETSEHTNSTQMPGKTINFFEQAGLTKPPLVSFSKAQKFGRRRAWVLALCDTRSNFEGGLGSGLGISAGSGGGGACAGGVCLR